MAEKFVCLLLLFVFFFLGGGGINLGETKYSKFKKKIILLCLSSVPNEPNLEHSRRCISQASFSLSVSCDGS